MTPAGLPVFAFRTVKLSIRTALVDARGVASLWRRQWRNGACWVKLHLAKMSFDAIVELFIFLTLGADTIAEDVAVRGGSRWKRRTRLLGAVDSGKIPAKSPCYPNYCRNGGACKLDRRQHTGFRCDCKAQFSGLRCDNGIRPLNTLLVAEFVYCSV